MEYSDVLHHSVAPPFIPDTDDKALWKTFNTLKYKITGLDLRPDMTDRSVLPQEAVKWVVLGWYESFVSDQRSFIAYKGGVWRGIFCCE